jgi:uncharacterized DUF497 family protein
VTAAGEERFLAYGITDRGRYIKVSFTERSNERIRPITAFDMARKEIKR